MCLLLLILDLLFEFNSKPGPGLINFAQTGGWALDHGRDMYKYTPPTLQYSEQLS